MTETRTPLVCAHCRGEIPSGGATFHPAPSDAPQFVHLACRRRIVEDRREAAERLAKAAPVMLAACRAALLFHDPAAWAESRAAEWVRLAGPRPCTSRDLCEVIRAALKAAEGGA